MVPFQVQDTETVTVWAEWPRAIVWEAVEGENDLLGSTVKKELEINGDMPNAFDSLGLTEMGDAYVAFVEDGVACWNYGETGKYPTTVGSAVENTTKIFDMVCMKASDAEADAE